MDMSGSYQAATALCFLKATIVFDRFHVKKLILDGMDRVRREGQGKKLSRSHQAGKKLPMVPSSKGSAAQRA